MSVCACMLVCVCGAFKVSIVLLMVLEQMMYERSVS